MNKKRSILVLCDSISNFEPIKDGIKHLRTAAKEGLINWMGVEVCSANGNPLELRRLIKKYSDDKIDAIIAVAGKLAALFGDVDAELRNVLKNSKTRVIAVPLKGETKQASLAALLSVLEVVNHKMIFEQDFFENPLKAFEYATSGDLPEIVLEEQKPAEFFTPAQAYEAVKNK